ncbi:MAG: LysM peptidoglycan-binding domain-containing protein [Cyclobacteriaceae bacterium]
MIKCWLFMFGLSVLVVQNLAANTLSVDSVGIEKIGDQSFIIHQVEPQETLFGISRRYNTQVNDIVQNNDNLKDGLKIGQRIKVPYVEKETLPPGASVHQVNPGETLFAIAQNYNVPLQDLMAWNDLKGTDLSVGQSLLIKGLEEKAHPIEEEVIMETAELADQNVAVTNQPVKSDSGSSKKKKVNSKAEMPKRVEKSTSPSNKNPQKSSPSVKPAETVTKSTVPSTGNWISHKVDQGETLFSIAQFYDTKVEDLIKLNGLSSNNLTIGQTLKVGRETNPNIPVTRFPEPKKSLPSPNEASNSSGPPTKSTLPTSTSGSSSAGTSNVASSTAFKNIKENGQAEVIEGTGNHKKYLVLHRNAPVGTIMRIRNEENDVTVFARVVGVLPNTGDNDKLIIKVSKAAFDQLKAVNSRFRVEVAY